MRIQLILMLFFAALVAGTRANGDTRHPLCRGFLPENDMRIPESMVLATGITRTQFDEVLDRVALEYAGEVAAHGGRLVMERKWSDATVNAYAYREGRNWIVSMYGGMARHSRIDYDGFLAIACHEVGHHLGGAPLFTGDDWATVEGGADYYATLKCLRRVFRNDDNEKILARRKLDPTAVATCQAQYPEKQEQLICTRAVMAGLTLGSVGADLERSPLPKLTTPDRRRVRVTFEDHPNAQCRTDTYFEGSLCRASVAQPMSNVDYRIGSCASTGVRGTRPRCWFSP